MDKKQAQKVIVDLFTQAFDREKYQQFLRNLLNDYEVRDNHYTGSLIPKAFRQHIKQYWRVGKYVDPNRDELDLLVVQVSTLNKLERARTALRNFAVNRLKQFEKEASLIAFYAKDDGGADWRFSFVKIDHETYQDEGKVKSRRVLTPAKRYSYLVGVHENSHTASKQLLPLLEMDYADPKMDEIETSFSIDKITGEFFDQYKALFQKLAQHLKKQPRFKKGGEDERDRSVSRFAKKLLGQIVFLYFLQKKGWLGVPKGGNWGEGEKRFLRQRYDKTAKAGKNYYNDFLQYLFYEALAKERKGQKDPGYYKRFNCRVPFLNGGLFEADYKWQEESIDLPNDLFHNDEKTNAGDMGTGILDVFDRYNFTIKEDEPLEKEVAVDPEMLGKVFENMLEITERRKKGAFYTPREIAHYMCQEGLIQYLDNRLNTYPISGKVAESHPEIFSDHDSYQRNEDEEVKVPKSDLETLIRKGHLALENDAQVQNQGRETDTYKSQLPKSVRQYARQIDDALRDIKACDPAIGSGAFPVGLLHEIVNTRLAIGPHTNNKQTSYELKRHAIAESLYGVDTDGSAIDIARLRLWLSLIVDEEDFDSIDPLPNLEYKIVKGDSLLGLKRDMLNQDVIAELEDKKALFFNTADHEQKKALEVEIDALICQLTNGKKVFDFKAYFSEVWHQKDGFDLVIGNPPYVQIQNYSGQQIQKDWQEQDYKSFSKRGDIYCLFYEKGHKLLRKQGVLSYITSNKWMRAEYGKKLRQFFREKTQPLTLVDFSSVQVFETATVDTNILLFRKEAKTRPIRVCKIDPSFSLSVPLETFVESKGIDMDDFSEDNWVITNKEEYEIKKRIGEVGTPIKECNIEIRRGILTGFNEAFIIDGKKKGELIAADPKSAEIIKPILRGRDVKRYHMDFADLWLINVHNGHKNLFPVEVSDYPAIKAHLDQYKARLNERKDQGVTPYNLRNCAYLMDFSQPKIIYPETMRRAKYSNSGFPRFAIDTKGKYVTDKTAFILVGADLYWLLALLNSEVTTFLIPLTVYSWDDSGFLMQKTFIENIPVKQRDNSFQLPMENLVRYCMELKKDAALQSAYFEQLIDGLAYQLYFPKDINAAGKEILQHIGDLPPISDDMSSQEKLAVIQGEFDRLYDPSHPVRNNVETLDSVSVVRTIREALQRR